MKRKRGAVGDFRRDWLVQLRNHDAIVRDSALDLITKWREDSIRQWQRRLGRFRCIALFRCIAFHCIAGVSPTPTPQRNATCNETGLSPSTVDKRGTRYAQALSQAEETLGGRAQLAAFFHVPAEKIAAWLSGEEVPPLEVFLGSLDVIADGPYAPVERPRIRVAAIRQP